MNKPITPTDLITPKVTTGPIAGSRKVYSSPEAAPDLRVPLREIALSDPAEAPVRVYDPSGLYTDLDAAIDVEAGLPRLRTAWVRERGGVEDYEGRTISPWTTAMSPARTSPAPFRTRPTRCALRISPSPPLWGGWRGASRAGWGALASRASADCPHPRPLPTAPRVSAAGTPAGEGRREPTPSPSSNGRARA